MTDGDTLSALQTIAESLKRLADQFAPVEEPRQKRQAILSTAIYDREERERQKLREALREKEQKPEGRITPPYECG
jgi:dTDP-4-amino-4,6-dideoxygalactose transaminase